MGVLGLGLLLFLNCQNMGLTSREGVRGSGTAGMFKGLLAVDC